MKIIKVSITAIVFSMAFLLLTTTNKADKSADYDYIGVKKCRMCHMSDKKGDQFAAWKKGPHSKAFETLGGAEAKKIAEEKGLGDPQKAPECLKCHVTGYNTEACEAPKKVKMEDGVGCESCHGPGSAYWKKKVMEDLTKGKIKGSSVGLVEPDEKLCVTCHNEESPTYKEFKFKEFYDKIAHPMPEEYLKKEGYPVK